MLNAEAAVKRRPRPVARPPSASFPSFGYIRVGRGPNFGRPPKQNFLWSFGRGPNCSRCETVEIRGSTVFNYRLSRASQPVECAFGILASRFRVFMRPFTIKVDIVDNVVKVACVLHNYLGTHMSKDAHEELETLSDNQLIALNTNASRCTLSAFQVRKQLTLISIQLQKILRGDEGISGKK